MSAPGNTAPRRQRGPSLDPFPRLLYWIGLTIVSTFVLWAIVLVFCQAVSQWRR
jgi:hypothetical protein